MGRTSDARERLLESAGRLIHERGYTAVGVGEICADAGVNKGSFYHFFPSKQQLVLDVVDQLWRQARSIYERTLLGDGPALARIRSYFEAMVEHHRGTCSEGQQAGCPLANLALEMSTQDPVLRERLAQAFDTQIGYFERAIDDARREGSIDEGVDPRAAAEGVVSLLEGKIMLSKLRDDPEVLVDLADQVEHLLGAAA